MVVYGIVFRCKELTKFCITFQHGATNSHEKTRTNIKFLYEHEKTETFVSLSSHLSRYLRFSTLAIIEPAKMEGRSRSKKKK